MAAKRRFMVEGYAGAGMEAVARDAQVSTATLYALFPSKARLFQAVLEDASSEFADRLEQALSGGRGSGQKLWDFLLAYAGFMSDPFVHSVFRLIAAERRRFDDVAQQFYDRARNDIGGQLIAVLQQMEAEGALRLDKPSWAAGQLMGMIEHPTFFQPLLSDDQRSGRTLEQVCDQALRTFLARYGAAACEPAPAAAAQG